METILVTGGCGFIGSNFLHLISNQRKNYKLLCLDKLTYAGNVNNIVDLLEGKVVRLFNADIHNKKMLKSIFTNNKIDFVINFAAESHVDRSIEDPAVFLNTNILGTFNLMEICREFHIRKFIQISTDEVYGSLNLEEDPFTERSNISPNNPYSASKASADLLVQSFFNTFDFPGIITRCSNNYGPYQFPEKLIPVTISNATDDLDIPVYGDGKNIRDWIYVDDHCNGILSVLEKGKIGEVYNFGGNSESPNIELVKKLLDIMGKPHSLIKFVKDRAGHDFRYAINYSKAKRELNWEPRVSFKNGLEKTVNWYKENYDWVKSIKNGSYLKQNNKYSI
ncbi:MAG: dTDP-glucose 4,6-dehydratase [Promethearchaeota archaeon]